jgi:serine/threonine protein kinase
MIDPATSCPDCGATLPADSPQTLCPACLMRQALASRTLDPEGNAAPLSPPLPPEEIAAKFPGFEILECLGRGGMGAVYKARQKSLDRWVAIKILAPEREGRERFAERFAREAQTLARLSHPHIVTIHDFGQTGGLFYLVMEYIDGVNLRDLLRDGKLEPQQALAIVPPICEALQYAHDKGIVHRDIKPENLLLDRDGRVKIADFGIASLIGAENESAGTPAYMAPEQAASKREVDHRADIYALGVVLYEMLTGERPGNDALVMSTKLHGLEIDVRIDEMVLKALEKSPEKRFQSAGDFRTMVEAVATPAAAFAMPHRPKPPKSGRRLVIAAFASAAVVLLASAAGVAWQLRSTARTQQRHAQIFAHHNAQHRAAVERAEQLQSDISRLALAIQTINESALSEPTLTPDQQVKLYDAVATLRRVVKTYDRTNPATTYFCKGVAGAPPSLSSTALDNPARLYRSLPDGIRNVLNSVRHSKSEYISPQGEVPDLLLRLEKLMEEFAVSQVEGALHIASPARNTIVCSNYP